MSSDSLVHELESLVHELMHELKIPWCMSSDSLVHEL
jgi:hypothetical protein